MTVQSKQSEARTQPPYRIVVVGAVKDSRMFLERMKWVLHNTTVMTFNKRGQSVPYFQIEKLLFFENDSTDDTREELENNWNKTEPFAGKVNVIHDTLDPSVERSERIAFARNRIFQQLYQNHQKRGEMYDYILVVDMDDVNYYLVGMEHCLELTTSKGNSTRSINTDWSICCVNNYRLYYDLWALRTKDEWVHCDVWADCGDDGVQEVTARSRHIPAKEQPINVDSCFGGAALMDYTKVMKLMSQIDEPYAGSLKTEKKKGRSIFGFFAPLSNDVPRPICEHVTFNERMSALYPNSIYIQPKFLNSGGMEHVECASMEKWKDNIIASLNDPEQEQYYSVFDHENLGVDYQNPIYHQLDHNQSFDLSSLPPARCPIDTVEGNSTLATNSSSQ